MLFRRLPKDPTTSWKLALSANRSKGLNTTTSISNYNNRYRLYNTANILNLNDTTTTTNQWNRIYSTNVSKKLNGLSNLKTDPVTTSPYYNQLCAFDDNVNNILMDKNFRKPGFNTKNSLNSNSSSQNLALFWDSVTRSIHIYNDLVGVCTEMNQSRISLPYSI